KTTVVNELGVNSNGERADQRRRDVRDSKGGLVSHRILLLACVQPLTTLRPAPDAIDHIVRVRNHVEIPIRPLLDAGRDSETLADFEALAFRALKLRWAEEVVRNMIRQSRIGAYVDVLPIGGHLEPIQAAAIVTDLREASRGTEPQRAVVFG